MKKEREIDGIENNKISFKNKQGCKVNWKLSDWFEKLKFHFEGTVISARPHLISISGPFFHDLFPHRIPISPLNHIFGDLIYMQNAPKRQSQLLVISYCFSKSESIFYADSGCKYVHKSGPQSLDQETAGINKPN